MKKYWLCLLVALVLMGSAAAEEAVWSLPIDFSGGAVPQESGFSESADGDGWTYEDPSIRVEVTTGWYDETEYWQADIMIADASQLRTAAADSFDVNMTMKGTTLAKRVHAIVAMDGDYYLYRNKGGYIIRQGQMFYNELGATLDVLVIDEDGDFHAIPKATSKQLDDSGMYEGKRIINSFFFGPILVMDGEIHQGGWDFAMGSEYCSQRIALCQTGHLRYRIIATGSLKRGSKGMPLEEFRQFVASQEDVLVAYNMDGGDSTMLIFNGEKINDVGNPDARDIMDIVYFASAYQPED